MFALKSSAKFFPEIVSEVYALPLVGLMLVTDGQTGHSSSLFFLHAFSTNNSKAQ